MGLQDSWAICRIFKKTNSMAQRALSHSWVSPFPADSTSSDIFSHSAHNTKLTSDNISCTTETLSTIQFCCNNLSQSATNFSLLDVPFYKPINSTVSKPPLPPILNAETSSGFMFPTVDMSMPTKCTADVTSMLLNMPPSILGDAGKASVSVDSGLQQQCNIFTISIPPELHENVDSSVEEPSMRKNTNVDHDSNQWGATRTVGFPFSLPTSLTDAWKLNMPWDSPAPCPSEMSSSFSTNKCYTQWTQTYFESTLLIVPSKFEFIAEDYIMYCCLPVPCWRGLWTEKGKTTEIYVWLDFISVSLTSSVIGNESNYAKASIWIQIKAVRSTLGSREPVTGKYLSTQI